MPIAGSGQSIRSKVAMQTTRNAAPALCRVARAKGIPKRTMATPMQICSSTAQINKPPASLSARVRARARHTIPVKHQNRAYKHGADAMRHVNGNARGIREHAALVVESSPRHSTNASRKSMCGHQDCWQVGKSGQATAA